MIQTVKRDGEEQGAYAIAFVFVQVVKFFFFFERKKISEMSF